MPSEKTRQDVSWLNKNIRRSGVRKKIKKINNNIFFVGARVLQKCLESGGMGKVLTIVSLVSFRSAQVLSIVEEKFYCASEIHHTASIHINRDGILL